MNNLSDIYQVWVMTDFHSCIDSPIRGYMNIDSLYQLDFTHKEQMAFIGKEGEETITKSYLIRNGEVEFEGTHTKLKIIYLSKEELKVIYHATAQGVSINQETHLIEIHKIKGDFMIIHYKTKQ